MPRANTPRNQNGTSFERWSQEQLEGLLPFASVRQGDAIRALLEHGTVVKAAAAIGVGVKVVRNYLSDAKHKAARAGWSPEHPDTHGTHPVPDGFHVKGVSTYLGKNEKTGALEVRGRWVKTNKDADHELALLMDAVRDIAEPFEKKSRRVRAPRSTDRDLLCVYPMGDPHIGMFAWAKETGADFDLRIAERNLVDAVDHLVALAPPSREALVINLGDLVHADGKDNATTAGTGLDVDTRWSKVVGVALRAMVRCIDRALERHKIVHVVSKPGNHDEHTGLVLALCLQMYYANNPRVRVDTTPDVFSYHRFGSVLLGVAHGDACKPDQLPSIMACDRKEDWGATEHRHWLCGHVHHDTLKEYAGCTVETFRTLAPRDAWHHRSGYRSGQDLKLLVYHRKYGEIMRHIVGISRIWENQVREGRRARV